jgi:hypothetical protein
MRKYDKDAIWKDRIAKLEAERDTLKAEASVQAFNALAEENTRLRELAGELLEKTDHTAPDFNDLLARAKALGIGGGK